jgi:hypothetical protein
MQRDQLSLFYQNEAMRESFREFQSKLLEEMILEDCYTNDSKNGLALRLTKDLIEKSFSRLDDIFGEADKPITNNPR